MKNITLDKSYTRSTAEDERESLALNFAISELQPDATKILPAGTYRVLHGQLRRVVPGVSPTLQLSGK